MYLQGVQDGPCLLCLLSVQVIPSLLSGLFLVLPKKNI